MSRDDLATLMAQLETRAVQPGLVRKLLDERNEMFKLLQRVCDNYSDASHEKYDELCWQAFQIPPEVYDVLAEHGDAR